MSHFLKTLTSLPVKVIGRDLGIMDPERTRRLVLRSLGLLLKLQNKKFNIKESVIAVALLTRCYYFLILEICRFKFFN